MLREMAGVEKVSVCEDPERGLIGTGEILARSSAMVSEDAFVVRRASFTPSGNLLIVDAGTHEVWLVDRALDPIRRIGSVGQGPGEYVRPADAVQGEDSRFYVLDRSGGGGRLLIFDQAGDYVEGVALRVAGHRLAVSGSAVFISGPIISLQVRGQPGVPILVEYDLGTGKTRTLLRADPTWLSQPPLFNIPLNGTIPRVGKDGKLYLGWTQGYEIWRIDGPNEHTVVVRGCIPEQAMGFYEKTDGSNHRSFTFIGDFVVLEDGRLLVRTGLTDTEDRRLWELFSPEGDLLRSWAIDQPELHNFGIAINPTRPTEHLTWLRTEGLTRLLRLTGG